MPESTLVDARLRGFGPVGIVAILVIFAGNLLVVPLSAVLVLLWARQSGTPWHEIGFVRPRNWLTTIVAGMVFGIALKFLMKAVVMPLLGADPINQTYHYLVGNTAAIPGMLYSILIGAAIGEEILFRGFLFERLGKLIGPGVSKRVLIVLLSAALFGAAHLPEQGIPGMQQGIVVGLVFGAIYASSGRLFMLMIAHAAFDLTALAMIYWNLESDVAHLIFR